MRFYLWGLVVGILWAQLVWDWHAEQDQGLGYHIPAISSLPHSQLFYRVKLVGDTLWVMGNTCVREGDTLYLPSTDGAQEVYRNLSPAPVAVSYLAGYDRIDRRAKTGSISLMWILMRVMPFAFKTLKCLKIKTLCGWRWTFRMAGAAEIVPARVVYP
jgi:hypothetical protein